MTASTDKLILLDFDGVVNALSPRPDRNVHRDWKRTEMLGYPILYSPTVVSTINEVAGRDGVEVKWLTTWEAATADFAATLGFLDLDFVPAPDRTPDIRVGVTWKPAAGLELVPRYRATLWVDDDADIIRAAAHPTVQTLRPVGMIGMSKKNLRTLTEFADPW